MAPFPAVWRREAGPPPWWESTQARIFDVAGQGCDGIGAVLLNDLLACGPTPQMRNACLARLALNSRVNGVPFQKNRARSNRGNREWA